MNKEYDDYDIISNSRDGKLGELYVGAKRCAMWIERSPFGAWITLEDENGTYEGAAFQVEKTPDICRLWMEDGTISVGFRTDAPPES